MPHSSSEQSLVTNCHPVLMGNSDILVKDEFGQSNPLEVSDYTSRNGELVNLENACVNIDNSSDVIIGPVTQFNVNGNVTIYQNENGQQRPADEGGTDTDTRESSYDVNSKQSVPTPLESLLMLCGKQSKKQVILISIVVLITTTTPILYVTLSNSPSKEIDENQEGSYWCSTHIGKSHLYSRKDWNASQPLSEKVLPHPVGLVIISHSASSPCYSFQSCAKKVQSFQRCHIFEKRLDDICYNFLIGGDGNVFRGRGWNVVNCHKKLSIGINLIGNFEEDTLNDTMIDSLKHLIERGVAWRKISNDYILIGHNQTTDTLSPGKNAYKVIKNFSHFSEKNMRL
ncbi:peptidoglycan-recognition protein LA isoform X8 [Leptinotarsa decemlineata]|uniref:peptidoglycan-recognition protein LA isoform X8 n=1 Tax=Leptinotarsa decemlineata TaxID=7539 RepID=UPI003D30AF78